LLPEPLGLALPDPPTGGASPIQADLIAGDETLFFTAEGQVYRLDPRGPTLVGSSKPFTVDELSAHGPYAAWSGVANGRRFYGASGPDGEVVPAGLSPRQMADGFGYQVRHGRVCKLDFHAPELGCSSVVDATDPLAVLWAFEDGLYLRERGLRCSDDPERECEPGAEKNDYVVKRPGGTRSRDPGCPVVAGTRRRVVLSCELADQLSVAVTDDETFYLVEGTGGSREIRRVGAPIPLILTNRTTRQIAIGGGRIYWTQDGYLRSRSLR